MISDQNMKASLFRPVKAKRSFQEITTQIRQLIHSGVLKPEDKLPPERELAVLFETSRMTVREALRTLEQSGLVYVKHGIDGGAFIKQVDPTIIRNTIMDMIKTSNVTLKELTQARLGIEKSILEYAIPEITDDHLSLLKENIESSEKAIKSDGKVGQLFIDFHLLLARISKNAIFEMIVAGTMILADDFVKSGFPDMEYDGKTITSHKEIYEALQRRDVETAKRKMEEHLAVWYPPSAENLLIEPKMRSAKK
jgi:GntR family transcriptional regulator, transcriptional repressor for pyruvate dehydrogenase complex